MHNTVIPNLPFGRRRGWYASYAQAIRSALKKPWTKLEAPELTDELHDRVVAGCEEQSGACSLSDLDKNRNEFLVKLLELVKDHWPEAKKAEKEHV